MIKNRKIMLSIFSTLTILPVLIISCSAGGAQNYTDYTAMQQPHYRLEAEQDMAAEPPAEDTDYYPGTETFQEITFNPFVMTAEDNLSTFASDVDTGSYTFGRRNINDGIIPPQNSVRVEEWINYFNQDYVVPEDEPFSVSIDAAPSPFRDNLHLLRIGIRGRDLLDKERKPWNITFLIDVSGSMSGRIELIKDCLHVLVNNMTENDKISLATYAGSVDTLIEPTMLDDKDEILEIIDELETGGSTWMSSGIQNAYDTNMEGFIEGGVNRVIVLSDGDANVGDTSHEQILELISEYVDRGVTLSAIGLGRGNYNDYLMEQLADNGNGNYFYIDSLEEGTKLFTEDLFSVMEVIAKDVKIQVEFNPDEVVRYRLIGYENREITDEEFLIETTDAGEIGANHRVTALYEIELTGKAEGNLGIVHLRYKEPDGSSDIPVDADMQQLDIAQSFNDASEDFRFTAGVCETAEIIRQSPYVETRFSDVEPLIASSITENDELDIEFLELIRKLIQISADNEA